MWEGWWRVDLGLYPESWWTHGVLWPINMDIWAPGYNAQPVWRPSVWFWLNTVDIRILDHFCWGTSGVFLEQSLANEDDVRTFKPQPRPFLNRCWWACTLVTWIVCGGSKGGRFTVALVRKTAKIRLIVCVPGTLKVTWLGPCTGRSSCSFVCTKYQPKRTRIDWDTSVLMG
jgi:hypothetical protein